MATILHGIDLIECDRVQRVFERHGERFLNRILTAKEQELAVRNRHSLPFVSGRFAAKEAILKMIGTGWRGKIAWTDMEILPNALGKPEATLTGETARITAKLGVQTIVLSITHTKQHAAASVLGICDG